MLKLILKNQIFKFLCAATLCAVAMQGVAQTVQKITLKPQYKQTTCKSQTISLPAQLELCVTVVSSVDSDIFQLKINDTVVIKDIDTAVIQGVTGQYQNKAIGFKCVETFDAQGAAFEKLTPAEMNAVFKDVAQALAEVNLDKLIKLGAASREVIWTCSAAIDGKEVLSALVIFEDGR